MIVLGSVLVAICCLPFVAVNISRNKVKKHMMQLLSDLLRENNGTASKVEYLGKMSIALDENHQLLFFIKQHNDRCEKVVISLNDLRSCRLEKDSRTVTSDGGNYQLLESLVLHFASMSKDKLNVRISVFDITEDLHLNGELQFAERWSAIIDDQLRLGVRN